jgi:hypothetical protein
MNKLDLVLNIAPVRLADHATDENLSTSAVMMDRKQSICSYVTDDLTSYSSSTADASNSSAVERTTPLPHKGKFTGGFMGKLLACSAIPFHCHDVEEAQTVTSVASEAPPLVVHDDCVNETLNVEAYEDCDSKFTHIGFLDQDVAVESSPMQTISKEEGMKATSTVILKTRMMPGVEVDNIARKLLRQRIRAEVKVLKKSQII